MSDLLRQVSGRVDVANKMRTSLQPVGLEKLKATLPLLRESEQMLKEAAEELVDTGRSSVGITDLDQVYLLMANVIQEIDYYEEYLAWFEHKPLAVQSQPVQRPTPEAQASIEHLLKPYAWVSIDQDPGKTF